MKISEKNYTNQDFVNFLKQLLENEVYADGNDEDISEFSDMSPAERHEYLQKKYNWSDDDLSDAFSEMYPDNNHLTDLEDDVATVDIDFLEQEPDYPDDGMTPEEVAKYIKYFGLTGIPGKLDSQGSRTYTVSGLRSNIDKMLADMDKSTSLDYKFPWDTDDVNGDGDTDITVVDTDDDGSPDTAITTADSKAEDKEATEVLKEKFEHDDEDITTTGKTKKELENETLSDERQKDKQQPKDTQQPKKKKGQLIYDDEQDSGVSGWLKKMSPARNKKSGGTVSDVTQKNILKVLSEHRF